MVSRFRYGLRYGLDMVKIWFRYGLDMLRACVHTRVRAYVACLACLDCVACVACVTSMARLARLACLAVRGATSASLAGCVAHASAFHLRAPVGDTAWI